MQLGADELLTRVRLPRNTAGVTHYYRKVGTRKAQAISKVCLSATAKFDHDQIGDVRIALGSVAPIVIRCVQTENSLRGQKPDVEVIESACATLSQEISPIDDIRSTADYRLQVAKNLLRDFLLMLT
jgi:CO/xanthine dehydrogenase FAD-binding subunit